MPRHDEAQLCDPENTNEGLGILYERYVLDRFLERLRRRHGLRSLLEIPLQGISGIPGLTSFALARRGVRVTLADFSPDRLERIRGVWRRLDGRADARFVCASDADRLPFRDRAFELVWNFVGLWHVRRAERLLLEMARVASGLVLCVLPNRLQPGYWLRKGVIDPAFFHDVDERWARPGEVKACLARTCGMEIIEEGVLDVPPWPDTAAPVGEVLRIFGMPDRARGRIVGKGWHWNSIDYYGRKSETFRWLSRLTVLEDLPLPWRCKLLWAHHRYVLARKRQTP